MTGDFTVGLTAGLVAALLFGGGAVVQAHAVRRLEAAPDRLIGFLLASARDTATMLVVLAYLVGFALHAVAIWLLPLYLAQTTIAMSLPVTAVASTLVHERLSPVHWWAVGVVTLGLVLLAAGAGGAGAVLIHGPFVAALVAGVVVLALAAHFGSRLGGGVLGTLSGLGYGGSAIAVRGVGTPVEPLVVVAALTVPAYGVLAFWLYSLGLDRAPVSSTTAPLIVAETYIPAAVGIWFIGDGVREGWWAAAGLGLVLATAGAILLSREGIRSPASAATRSAPGPAR